MGLFYGVLVGRDKSIAMEACEERCGSAMVVVVMVVVVGRAQVKCATRDGNGET
jgi:hypothetical protein